MGKIVKKLSASKINSFYTCQFAYHCRYNLRKPQIKTPPSNLFGLMVHDIIPNYYDKPRSLTDKKIIPNEIEEAFTEGSDWRLGRRKDALRTCQNSFKSFEYWRIDNNLGKPTFTEGHLTGHIFGEDLPLVEGYIDAFWDGHVWVDWKTGKWAEMDDTRKIQGKIYEMLLKHNGYKLDKGIFVNLLHGTRHTLPNISESWLKNKVVNMLEMIENNSYRTIKSGLCNGWCGYRLSCDLQNNRLWVGEHGTY